jgi:hypothetical protein
MTVESVLKAAPPALEIASATGRARYELAEDLIAAHDAAPDPAAVLSLEGGRITARPVRDTKPTPRGRLGPVYRHAPGGGLAVPTGRVLARFPEGDSAAEHEPDIDAAGFRLEEILPYAPHAAWLAPTSGEIVDALRRLEQLAAVPGLEHVEPQLISERGARDRPET